MYLAHKCPQCHTHDIMFNSFLCSCGFSENENDFWKHMKNDAYLSDIEHEIEERYPFKAMSVISSVLELMVGYHVTNRFESRDYCINSLTEDLLTLYTKWGICYCDYSIIEDTIQEYEQISSKSKNEELYTVNKKSARDFFHQHIVIWKSLLISQ